MQLPKNVMIVEDEIITQRYLQEIAKENNIEVLGCFSNGLDVINALREDMPKMILMDINLEGAMDGIRLSKRILEKYSVPIVFISAHNDEDTMNEVLDLAPYGFIVKPFSSKDIIITLQVAQKRFLVYEEEQKNKQKIPLNDILSIDDDFAYEFKTNTLYFKDSAVKTNHKQGKLLGILAKNANSIVGAEILCGQIWGSEEVAASSLRTLVYNIRKMVPTLPLVSYSKLGYALETKEELS